MTTTAATIREVIGSLLIEGVIEDYRVQPDHNIRVELADGTWVAVGPDIDPEHPETDGAAVGYVWAAYDCDDGDPIDQGGDCTTATLADTIRKLARP